MNYSSHSPKDGCPAQPYTEHVQDVVIRVQEIAKRVAKYGKKDGCLLQKIAKISAQYHDLGKLESENQLVLNGDKSARALPYHHQDAGVAHFLNDEHLCSLAAVVISAHHTGLPDFIEEENRGGHAFRDSEFWEKTDALLLELEKVHNSLIPDRFIPSKEMPIGDLPVFLRLLLSCLVDADHTNTAVHYGKYPKKENLPELRPAERLKALDTYVASLDEKEKETDETRTALRKEMYSACRDADVSASICSCASPVGSGKTTAVMAHLLSQAHNRGLRRIFVVLPFTNIIQQSVEVYRKALVLPGEDPQDVVAELHHRADFESEDVRHLSALWRAPIVVTTAVAFFETLASKTPATLRRLHELPGSAVFVDESHAAMPAKLLPIAWWWMNTFADEWSCYWVLASGSLCRFWQIPEIAQGKKDIDVPEIVSDCLQKRLSIYEQGRISYKWEPVAKSVSDIVEWVASFPGPRLIIVNTVQSAAVLASAYAKRFGRECTEHLSTALTPRDREKTLKRVQCRLKDKNDKNWTLFATSCVEAGVNLSFRIGFREIGSLVSLAQISGRINREGEDSCAEVWSFLLEADDKRMHNPGLEEASEVLKGYFEKNVAISPDLSTKSISSEIRRYGKSSDYENLLKYEDNKDFISVQKHFNVIETNTRLAVVDPKMVEQVRSGKINWRELQRNSVQIEEYKLIEANAPEIFPSIYNWNLGYDDFIGYMAGELQ